MKQFKENIINYAKNTWPLMFSKFYEVKKIAGPDSNGPEMKIAVNSAGIHIFDHDDQILRQLSFEELSEINYQKYVLENLIQVMNYFLFFQL